MAERPNISDLRACEVLWKFNSVRRHVRDPDAFLVMGSNDLNVATYAGELAERNRRSIVICSGGIAHHGDLLDTGWTEPEADVFAREMISRGVDPRRMLIERSATNTAENVIRSRALAKKANVSVSRLMIVQKPFMCLRALKTAQRHWPDAQVGVTCEKITFGRYFERYGRTDLIDIIAGDTQRVISYAKRDFFAATEVPSAVQEALKLLIARGYTAHMPA
jgi:uncharacterized SAM-binding protein YcdF (DUF218 family)